MSENTYYTWKRKYVGSEAEDLRRLRDLDRENAQLKRILAEMTLEIDTVKGGDARKWDGAPAKRAGAQELMEAGLSERRACAWVGIRRSSFRYERREDRNAGLRERLKEMAKPGVGYRQAWARLRKDFAPLSRKRVYRLWKEEGLSLRKRKSRKIKTGKTVPTKAERPNHV